MHEQVSEGAMVSKELAMQISAPVLALAQLSRLIEQRAGKDMPPTGPTTTLSDLRGSAQIEQDAGLVLAIERARDPAYHAEAAIVRVLKARGGPCGVAEVWFDSGHFFEVGR
jgi:replicative DNA helicase